MSKINNFNELNTKKYYIKKKDFNEKIITKKKIVSIKSKSKGKTKKKNIKPTKRNTIFTKRKRVKKQKNNTKNISNKKINSSKNLIKNIINNSTTNPIKINKSFFDKLPFKDSYQKNIQYRIISNFNSLKNKKIDTSVIESYRKKFKKKKLEKVIRLNLENDHKMLKFPLGLYKIRNNDISISEDFKDIIIKQDNRLEIMLSLFKKTIKWALKNNLKVPNTDIYFWIKDEVPFLDNDFDNFPLWVFAKPLNTNFILCPNNAFECFQMEKKYKGKCYDWDALKEKINENCVKNIDKREDKIYFKGVNTTIKNNNIRYNFYKLQFNKYNKLPLEVKLDGFKKYEPFYNVCNYKYLLNLPGKAAWSYRLQNCLLTKSININIDLENFSDKDNWYNERYITFINYIVNYNYFINIKYIFNEDKGINSLENRLEFNKAVKKINNVYNYIKKNKKKYKIMTENAHKKVYKLTNERIYQSIYLMFCYQSQFKFV